MTTVAAVTLLTLTFAAPPRHAAPGPDLLRDPDSVDRLLEPLRQSPPADADADDPLRRVEQDMTWVTLELDSLRTHEPVRERQAQILSQLDALIEQVQQQNSSSGSGSGAGAASASPTSPMRDSQLTGGPGGIGELTDPGHSRRPWAELPPKERERILQANSEDFPPGYERLLESYYRRLAEEKVPTPLDEAGQEQP